MTKEERKLRLEKILNFLAEWLATSFMLFILSLYEKDFDLGNFPWNKWQSYFGSIIIALIISVLFEILKMFMRKSLKQDFIEVNTKLNTLRDNKLEIDRKLDEISERKIIVNESQFLGDLKSIRPLYRHYDEYLHDLPKNLKDLKENKCLSVSPFEIYRHIITAYEEFEISLHSVDCDILAWYNICDYDDFKKYNSNMGKSEKEFYTAREKRIRTDLTYQVHDKMIGRLEGKVKKPLKGGTLIKRIFILQKNRTNLSPKEKSILSKLKTYEDSTKGAMSNKIIFFEDIKADSQNKIRKLQDLIIFDNKVAFQEPLLDETLNNGKSLIIINNQTIKDYMTIFDELFDSNRISHKIVELL